MALFKKKTPPAPMPRPALKTCVCGATADADHLDTHIVTVTMPAGHPGRSYDCPLCGPSEVGYGNPGEHPISLRNISHTLFRVHCKEAHDVDV